LVKGAIKYLNKYKEGFRLADNLPESVRECTRDLLEPDKSVSLDINLKKLLSMIDRLTEEGKIRKITTPPAYCFYNTEKEYEKASLEGLCEQEGFTVSLFLCLSWLEKIICISARRSSLPKTWRPQAALKET
jgi:hypothetical protein